MMQYLLTAFHSLRLFACRCNTGTEKNLQLMSDKCNGGGIRITQPSAVFSCL